MRRLKQFIAIFFSLVLLGGLIPTLLAANIANNSGFNNPFNDISGRVWRGQNEKIADGWTHFYIEANTDPGSGNASKLRWMSSAQFAAAFGGIDYHIEGDQSQSMWSSYAFDGGVYQQISGVTPGQAYGFDIGMVTFWRGPGYPDSDGKMVRQVGIDPTGGTDPTSSNIVWSETNDNDKAWVYMDVAATAQATTITVFAKVQAPENDSSNHTDLDMVYFDAAHVDVAPGVAITALNNGTTVNANWVGSIAPGWSLKGFEVQYKDLAGGDWISLQSKNQTNTSATFTGQAGHTYAVRVRTWQRMAEPYNSDIDMPGVWAEQQVTLGNAISGHLFDHLGQGLSGGTISIQGTATNTTSTTNGAYILPTGGAGTFSIVANDFNGLTAPPATAVTVPANGIATLDITLRPTAGNQAITNNDFETDLSSWTMSNSAAVSVSTVAAHTGQRGLLISDTVQISQTKTISGMNNPVLSFWYKNDAPFTASLLGQSTATPTMTLSASNIWIHTTLAMNISGVYSGPIGVNFSYIGAAGAKIFVDEVSIGPGPFKVYLPIMLKTN